MAEIAIQVPPGTAGMAPRIHLAYNSQAGNGLLGVGWSLSGLSAITRCPQTPAQDGVRGGVHYDMNDRFCLDGQRLVAISGAYGADGTEYRTERDSFARVVSYGSAGDGPAWFRAWTKSGQVMDFGNSADSRIEAQGKPTVRVYAVNRVADTRGNYFAVAYIEDHPNGDYYPDRIDYTGNATTGTVPTQSVQFTYEARPDIVPLYHAGSIVRNTVRLKSVRTHADGTPVNEYRIEYATGPATRRSVLQTVRMCDAGGNCLAPVGVSTLEGGDNSFAARSDIFPSGWNFLTAASNYSRALVGDFNGNGRTDYMEIAGAHRYVFLSNGDGTFTERQDVFPNGWNFGTAASSHSRALTGDFDGDGKTDYMEIAGVHRYVFLSNGDGTFRERVDVFPHGWNFGTVASAYSRALTGDFDGDGRTDYMEIAGPYRYVFLSNGDGTFRERLDVFPHGWNFGTVASGAFRAIAGDFNGDGKTDYLEISGPHRHVFLSNGDGTFSARGEIFPHGWNFGTAASQQFQALVGDFNGDGKVDYMEVRERARYVFLSRGDGTFAEIHTVAGIGIPPCTPMSWSEWLASKGWWESPTGIRYPTPDGESGVIGSFEEVQWMYSHYASTACNGAGQFRALTGDFNGDGRTDYTAIEGTQRFVFLSNGDGTFSERVDQFPNGWNFGTVAGAQFRALAGDFNGDGKADYLEISGANRYVFVQGGPPADLMSSVARGLGAVVNLSYKPLTDSGVYTRETGAAYPMLDLQAPLHVVSSHANSNGVGGMLETRYAYTGAKADLAGRGFLGFRLVQVTDAQGLTSLTSYRQDWPYAGLPAQVRRTRPDGGVLTQVDNTYACKDTQSGAESCAVSPGSRYFPYVSQSDELSHDLNGAFVTHVRTNNSFDVFGNATQIVVTHLDAMGAPTGHQKVTTHTYTNNEADWILGRLTRSTVQSSVPDAETAPSLAGNPGGNPAPAPPASTPANIDIGALMAIINLILE